MINVWNFIDVLNVEERKESLSLVLTHINYAIAFVSSKYTINE